MNDKSHSWWNAGLTAAILLLAVTLLAGQASWAEGAAGLAGLVLLGVCLVALLLVVAALWPGLARRARQNLETSPGKSFLVGLVNYLFLGAVAIVTSSLGVLGVVGLLLVGLLLAGTFLGLPAAASLAGARLHRLAERETSGWGEVAAGSVALYLASLVPGVGWFLVLPALCLWSLGAAILAILSRKEAPRVEG